jgi:cytosine deaminase
VAFVALPNVPHFWLVNGRIPRSLLTASTPHRSPIAALAAPPNSDPLVAVDVEICSGQIAAIAPPQSAPDTAPQVDLRQGLIWPCFVDVHTHLDKGHIWHRQPNPDGTFNGALNAVIADADAHWSAEDLYRRMTFSLRCAYAHGTRALRTHFDAFGEMATTALTVLQTLQQEWAGRVEIQVVSLVSLDYYLTAEGQQLADQVAEYGGILGGVAYTNPDIDLQIDHTFALAAERGLALDLHVDESLDTTDICLQRIAQAKVRQDFTLPVVCGHCCSLSVQSPEVVAETLHWVKTAEMAVVSLPLCNLYLQDRHPGVMPRYRGVTLLHELKAAGIPVAIASDNCRDPFYAYGDLDGLEVFTQATRIGHLDRPYGDWAQAITTIPADLMGLSTAGRIGPGLPADLILFKARTLNELLARPQSDRVVMRAGQAIATALPDYAELDDLVSPP